MKSSAEPTSARAAEQCLGKAGLRPLLLLLGVAGRGQDGVQGEIGLLDLVQRGQRVGRPLR